MSRDLPVLLVDVDGVLNVYGVSVCPDGYEELDLFPGEEPVRLCRSHGDWLRELAEHFDLFWATGWGADAPRVLSPILRIDEFPAVPMPPTPFEPSEKVPAIARFVGDRAAAWLDDVVTPEAHAWAMERSTPTLLVDVDPRRGLDRSHVDALIAWSLTLANGERSVARRNLPPSTR